MKNAHHIIQVKSPSEMQAFEVLDMLEKFNNFGFIILQHKPSINPKKHLLNLSKYFGNIISHEHSDVDGIVPVSPVDGFPSYVNTTTSDLPLHTDCSFAEIPPKIVALQCEIAAESGGITRLGDGKLVYKYLARENKSELLSLFHPDAMTVQRANREATKPIFEEHQGRIHIRFRSDNAVNILVKPEAINAFREVNNFFQCSKNQALFKMDSHQILIMNNSRILHGRTSFHKDEQRKFNRIWFDGVSSYANDLQFGFCPSTSPTFCCEQLH
jgi:alpha-ketoglutarate-dependent taurine dioxygenase